MGRPRLEGCTYYPKDVGFITDEKIRIGAAVIETGELRKQFSHPRLIFGQFVDCLFASIWEHCTKPYILTPGRRLDLADRMRITPAHFDYLLDVCFDVEVELFLPEPWARSHQLTSTGLERRISEILQKRERNWDVYASKTGAETDAESAGESAQSEVKRSEVNKKGKGRRYGRSFSAPSFDDKQAANDFSLAIIEARTALKARGNENPNQDEIRAEAQAILQRNNGVQQD